MLIYIGGSEELVISQVEEYFLLCVIKSNEEDLTSMLIFTRGSV